MVEALDKLCRGQVDKFIRIPHRHSIYRQAHRNYNYRNMEDPLVDIPKIIQIILGSGKKDSKDQKNYAEEITKYYHENVEYKTFMNYIPSGRKSRDSLIALSRFYRGNYLLKGRIVL